MKKIFISMLCAIGIGFVLGFVFLRKFNPAVEKLVSQVNQQVYAFQVGVYRNYENAVKMASDKNGIIVLDNDIYRVYVAVLNDKDLISKLKSYYDKEGFSYYLKAIDVSSDVITIIDNYQVLLRSSDEGGYRVILSQLMKELKTNEL